jgi:hypothetical protein
MAPGVTGAPLDGSKEYEIAELCDATPWHFSARLFCTTRRSTDGKESVAAVCDVELQAGEQVNSIHLGDTARWSVEPAISGVGGNEVQHLIIKPHDVGLETSLIASREISFPSVNRCLKLTSTSGYQKRQHKEGARTSSG